MKPLLLLVCVGVCACGWVYALACVLAPLLLLPLLLVVSVCVLLVLLG